VTNPRLRVQYIEEILPVRPHVTQVTTYEADCAVCGTVRSTHPLQTSLGQGAAAVMLGPRALALAASLNKEHGPTVRTTCRVLKALTGLRITLGGLVQALQRVSRKVGGQYEALQAYLRKRAAVYADETSWWVGGPGWWLWVFTTPHATLYRVDASRGSAVVQETLGDDYGGVLVSDCLSTYDPAPYRKHKCIAHHLRAIAKARDTPATKETTYLRQWELLFAAVRALAASRTAMDESDFAQRRRR
jgi:transposase